MTFNPTQADFTIRQENSWDDAMYWQNSRDAAAVLSELDWHITAFAITCDDSYLAGSEAGLIEGRLIDLRDQALQYAYDDLDIIRADWVADNAAYADSVVTQYTEAKLAEIVA